MPVEISWLQPGRVLYQRMYGAGIVDDTQAPQQAFLQPLAASKAPIHIIIDLTGVTEAPRSLADVRKRIMFSDKQHLGQVIFVSGNNPIVRYFASVLSQVVLKETSFLFLETVEEAIQYLRTHDQSITIEANTTPNA